MSKLNDLIKELCPDGVVYKALWEVTTWDKKFTGVEKFKQPEVIKYHYILGEEQKNLVKPNGEIKILTTYESNLYAIEEEVKDILSDGEIVCIPWGGNVVVQYYKGKFITGDNRIATSNDTKKLSNKFLYYILKNKINELSLLYRGSGIKHPEMSKVLEIKIPVPPLPVQEEIVRILDKFEKLEMELAAELAAELVARKRQYEFYRNQLLSFDAPSAYLRKLIKECLKSEIKKVRLGDVCEMKRGTTITKENSKVGPYPVISGGKTPAYYIDTYNREGKTITIAGSGANAGYVQFWNEPIFVCDAFSIKGNNNIKTRFLYHCLSNLQEKIYATKKGSGVPHVHISDIENFKIYLPPIEIQNRIVEILDNFDKICNDLQIGLPREIELRNKQYEFYRNSLLNFSSIEDLTTHTHTHTHNK